MPFDFVLRGQVCISLCYTYFIVKLVFAMGHNSGAEWEVPTSEVLEAVEKMQAEKPRHDITASAGPICYPRWSVDCCTVFRRHCRTHARQLHSHAAPAQTLTCKDIRVSHLRVLVLNMFDMSYTFLIKAFPSSYLHHKHLLLVYLK